MVETLQDNNLLGDQDSANPDFNQELHGMLIVGRHERAEKRAQEIQRPYPDDVAGFSRQWGIKDSEVAKTIIERAQEREPFVRVAHRISRENFNKLIDSGGDLKSFFDTGITQGGARTNMDSYQKVRRDYEEKYGLRQEDGSEIIHGFLEDVDLLGEQDLAQSYGPVEIVFKEDVSNRSVYTTGDSLQTGEPPVDMMSALRSRELQSQRRQTGENDSYRGYAEALILDEVGLRDAETIVYDDVNSLTYDETLQQIDQLHLQYPDLTYTLRVDATETVYLKKLLQLVTEKSYIKVVLAVEVVSPFLRSKMDPDPESFRNIYQDKTERLSHIEERMQLRWAEMGHEGEPLPDGIKTAVVLKGIGKD